MDKEYFTHLERGGFSQLRQKIHKTMEAELVARKEKNPKPSEEELYLDVFREEIEPQVRDAVFILLKKGYELTSSGFSGEDQANEQHIVGFFTVDENTKEELRKRNVHVRTENRIKDYPNTPITEISFQCVNDDTNSIKDMWNDIANLLPALSDKMIPSRSNTHFRALYAPERTDLEIIDLERRLKEGVWESGVRERIECRMEELRLEQKSKKTGLSEAEKSRIDTLKREAFEEETRMLEELTEE